MNGVPDSRLAAIDIGTQTIRLLVADIGPGERLHAVRRDRMIARLGADRDNRGNLAAPAMQRARDCLAAFVQTARDCRAAAITAVATACMREAPNGAVFANALTRLTGVRPQILSGIEEARLSLAGVRSVCPTHDSAQLLVCDIGGGSTELVMCRNGSFAGAESLPLGVLTLDERYYPDGPVDDATRTRAEQAIETVLGRASLLPDPAAPGDTACDVIGTAGTVTTLAAMLLQLTHYDPDRINGCRLGREAIRTLYHRLLQMNPARRALLPGLEQGRQRVIVPGAAIVLALLARCGCTTLTVSDAGLLEGAALDLHRQRSA